MKYIHQLFLIIIFSICICGCSGGGNESTLGPGMPSNEKFLEVSGTLSIPTTPMLSSASVPSFAFNFNGGKHSISVVDKDNMKNEIGSVTLTGNNYKAVIPITNNAIYPMIIIKQSGGDRILYRNLIGKMPKTYDVPSDAFIVKLTGLNIDGNSTARALFAFDKGVPDIAVAKFTDSEVNSGVIYKDYSLNRTDFDEAVESLAGGHNNICQAAYAVISVTAVLNSFEIEESVKNKIMPGQLLKITDLLIFFVNTLKIDSTMSFIGKTNLASSVTIDNSEISIQTSSQKIPGIINSITPVNDLFTSAPVFSPQSGTYNETKYLNLTTATAGASIYYTEDGTAPSKSGKLYSAPIRIDSRIQISAIAVKNGYPDSPVVTNSYVIDKNAPAISIQYYLDPSLEKMIDGVPRLRSGTYYVKISSTKELKAPPLLTINAEGTANDITLSQTSALSGNDYKFERVIKSDAAAKGFIREEFLITAAELSGTFHYNLKPADELLKAAFIDTVSPGTLITYSTVFPAKQGTAFTIKAEISEDLSSDTDLKVSFGGAETLQQVSMSKTDPRHYTYVHTVGSSLSGSVFVTLSSGRDMAGNVIEETPSAGRSFSIGGAVTSQTNIGSGTITTEVPVSNLSFDNAAGKVILSNASIIPNKIAKLEVYFGAYAPVAATIAAASTQLAASHSIGDLITGINLQAAGTKIFYRFVDASGNASKWTQDGTVPATTNLIVSKIYASASPNTINIEESHASLKIAVYINDSYRQTIIHSNAAADSVTAEGLHIAANDTFKYAVEDADGNRSSWLQDGAIPSAKNLDVSKIYASAALNKINVDATHPPLKIAVYGNGMHRQTITHSSAAANSLSTAGYPLAVNDRLEYAVEDNNGNHSILISDGAIPSSKNLDVSKIYASAALNSINISAKHNSLKIAVYVSDIYRQTIIHASAAADCADVEGTALAAGNTLKYTVEDMNGNHSTFVSDGGIPAVTGLDAAKIYACAALNTVNIDEGHATSKIAVFVNDEYRQTINHINAASDTEAAPGKPLAAGNTLKYAIEDINGNHSALISDGTIPNTANLDVSKIYASAALNKINIDAAHNTLKTGVFVNETYRQTISHIIGTANAAIVVGNALITGDTLKYTIEDSNGNHSIFVPDGAIPDHSSLDTSKIHISAAFDKINIDAAHITLKVAVYVSDSYRQTINHINASADAVTTAGADLAAGSNLKYAVEDAGGNHSRFVPGGMIPAVTGLDVSKIYASAALNTINIDESHTTLKIAVFVNDAYRQTISHANAAADKITVDGPALSTGSTLKYAVEDENGNHSALISDGAIPSPASLDVSKIYASAPFNKINVTQAHNTLKIAAYVSDSYRQTISHIIGTANAAAVVGEPIASNDTLKYAVEDSNGNHSILIPDGAIPSPASLDVSKISANASLNTIKINGSHPNARVAVFINNIYRQTINHAITAEDSTAVAGTAMAAGNTLEYAAEDESGNHSDLVADGAIPSAPSALGIPAVAGRSNANYISAASAVLQSINVTFAAAPSPGTINITLKSSGNETVSFTGATAASSLITNLTGLNVDGLTADGQLEQFCANLTNNASGNTSANYSQITTGMSVDKTPPSFTARLYENDGVTRVSDFIPAAAANKLVLAFSENILASTVNTSVNTGINTDFSIKTNGRSTPISGFTAAGASTFTNSAAVNNNLVTITLNTVPTAALNILRNSPGSSTNMDADTVINCITNQITDAAGNFAASTPEPVK